MVRGGQAGQEEFSKESANPEAKGKIASSRMEWITFRGAEFAKQGLTLEA